MGERGWNIFDTTIVTFNVVELILETASSTKSFYTNNVVVLRVFRVLRLVRVVRVIRVVRFFRDLRIMVHTIISSVKSLLWVVTILCGLLYIFGISLTWGAYETYTTCIGCEDPAFATLRKDFGTLERSVLSLYMAISSGRDWGELFDSLKPTSVSYQMQF